jgi:hypothetical protein
LNVLLIFDAGHIGSRGRKTARVCRVAERAGKSVDRVLGLEPSKAAGERELVGCPSGLELFDDAFDEALPII